MANPFSDFLFGTEGEPEKLVDVSPEEFQATRGTTADALQRVIAASQAPAEGPFVAGITGQEQGLVDLAVSQAGDSPLARAARQAARQTATGEFLTGAPGIEETVQTATAPTREAIQRLGITDVDASGRIVVPEAQDPFSRAAQIGARGAAEALTDVERNIRSQSFQRETERQQQAIKLASDVASGGLRKTLTALKAAALPRLIEDMGIERGLEEFNNRINRLLESINTGIQIGKATPAQLSPTAGSPGLIQQGLQAGSSFLGGGGTVKDGQLISSEGVPVFRSIGS